MNLTDLQEELREIKEKDLRAIEDRLSVLHGEIEKLKPQDKPELDIDFERITSMAARSPLVCEQLRTAQPATKKTFFAALAYLIALDSVAIEDKLYYICRLALGCNYQVTAEDLHQMGLDFASHDLENLVRDIAGYVNWFIVHSLVVANLTGSASRDVLGALATMADSLEIEADKMRDLGLAAHIILHYGNSGLTSAQTFLRLGKTFATLDQALLWGRYAICKVGDTFTFGNYPQDDSGEDQPIEWQVLRCDNDGLLVISKYALDCKKYNESSCNVTWTQCTLRNWLNSEFFNQAFNGQERQLIKTVRLDNPNSHWNSKVFGGPVTDDRIFLLSHNEAASLFANNEERECRPTAYAKKNNADASKNTGMCYWWLRSPGRYTNLAAVVSCDGSVGSLNVNDDSNAVRPALKIAL